MPETSRTMAVQHHILYQYLLVSGHRCQTSLKLEKRGCADGAEMYPLVHTVLYYTW